MPSEFLKQKLGEIDARIQELDVRIGELEDLRAERDALTRAREAMASELSAIAADEPRRQPSRAATADPRPGGRRPLAPEAQEVADEVMELLAADPELTVDEVAARTGKAPGALHRLLLSLQQGGRVVQRDGRFSRAS
jgi:predicted Rossmann fold nucleotide-binding protein DprA/Smf involved in DNA uptake